MFLLDGKVLSPDQPFEHGGVKYPANWLRLSTPEDKAAIGITDAPEPEYFDQRFYWGVGNPKRLEDEPAVNENGDPLLDADGNQIINRGLKSDWIAQQKQIAGSLLAQTDWYIVRKSDVGVEIPANIQHYRDDIRLTCGLREDQISQCTTTDQLAALATNSPTVYDEATGTQIPNSAPFLLTWPKAPTL